MTEKCTGKTSVLKQSRGLRPVPGGLMARVVLMAMAIALASMSGLRAQEVELSLAPDYFEVGERGELVLTFSGLPALGKLEFNTATYEGFDIVPTNKKQTVVINGSRKDSFFFMLVTKKPGEWTIPPLAFQIGRKQIKTNEVRFRVYPKGQAPKSKFPRNEAAFLVLDVPDKKVYIGETIPVKISIYYDSILCQEPSWPEIEATGFKLEEKEQGKTYTTDVHGRQFYVTETFRVAVPMKTGRLQLGPATGSIQMRQAGINSIFGLAPERREIRGDAVEIECIPFPDEGRPDDFNGAIGTDFVITYSASPTDIALGDPVTVSINILGNGNISEIQLPESFRFQNFKSYEPKTDSMVVDKQTMRGRKNFEFVVIPQNASIKALPELSFSYFDSEKESYETMVKAGPALNIAPGDYRPDRQSGAREVDVAGTGGDEDGSRPAHIEYSLGTAAGSLVPASGSLLFWSVPGGFFLLFAGTLGWRTYTSIREKMNSSGRNADRLHREEHENRLYELNMFANANQPKGFFSTMFRLLQEVIAMKLGCQSAAITADIINRPGKLQGLPVEDLERLRRLFELCDQARYGMDLSNVDLASARNEFNDLSQRIENL